MPSDSIRVVARLVAKRDSVDRVGAILQSVVEPTRKEAGCLSYELLHNCADPTDFTFVEEWASDRAIDDHMTTQHISDALTKLTGLLSSAPDIRRYQSLK